MNSSNVPPSKAEIQRPTWYIYIQKIPHLAYWSCLIHSRNTQQQHIHLNVCGQSTNGASYVAAEE